MLEILDKIVDLLSGLIFIYSCATVFKCLRDYFPMRVKLSIGSFTVKRKHYNAQSVTNIVSAKFYDGGLVPDNVRKEIIVCTSPRIWNFVKFEKED